MKNIIKRGMTSAVSLLSALAIIGTAGSMTAIGEETTADKYYVPGSYTVTANLYMKSEDSGPMKSTIQAMIAKDANIYMTNWINPAYITENDETGTRAIDLDNPLALDPKKENMFPITPVTENAVLTVAEDSSLQLTVPLKNPVFTLWQIGTGNGVEAVSSTRRYDDYGTIEASKSNGVLTEDTPFDSRINSITFSIPKDADGKTYTITDCYIHPNLLGNLPDEPYDFAINVVFTSTLNLEIDLSGVPERTQVSAPTANKGLVYNGSQQSGIAASETYDTVNGTATNAGTYTATVTPKKNYMWDDGTIAARDITWTIAKADQTVTVGSSSKSYKVTSVAKKKKTYKLNASGTGALSYEVTQTPSGAAKYISVKNGKVTLKKGAKAGTYTIKITAAGNENYNAATAEAALKVNKVSQKLSAKASKKTVKASSLKKKGTTVKIKASAKTKVSYKVISTPSKGSKYIKVNKSGKVTIKKKAPKGTYKIRVTAKANGTYKSVKKTVTIKVK